MTTTEMIDQCYQDIENNMVIGNDYDESPDPVDEDEIYAANFDLREEERRERANEIADETRKALIDMFGETDETINWSAGFGRQAE